MKAYSYLQLSIMQHNDTLPDGYMDVMERVANGKSPDEFYSEPFRPEMIVERFTGWKLLISPNSQTIIATHLPYDIVFHEMTPNCMTICTDDNGDVTDDFIKPRNLDEFIVQCQQAGIELEWK